MIDSARLAHKAHYAIVRDIIDLQARILLRSQLAAEFGPDAVEPMALFIRTDSVTKAAERVAQADAIDRARLAELLETAKAMEAVFSEHDEANMEAFAEFVRERYGRAAE